MAKIKFDIPEKLSAKVTVYDILGKEIVTLVNDKFISGSHEIDFDDSNLPGGVYYYKIETERITETKKIILKNKHLTAK